MPEFVILEPEEHGPKKFEKLINPLGFDWLDWFNITPNVDGSILQSFDAYIVNFNGLKQGVVINTEAGGESDLGNGHVLDIGFKLPPYGVIGTPKNDYFVNTEGARLVFSGGGKDAGILSEDALFHGFNKNDVLLALSFDEPQFQELSIHDKALLGFGSIKHVIAVTWDDTDGGHTSYVAGTLRGVEHIVHAADPVVV